MILRVKGVKKVRAKSRNPGMLPVGRMPSSARSFAINSSEPGGPGSRIMARSGAGFEAAIRQGAIASQSLRRRAARRNQRKAGV
jgi:hypothetical protein